MPKGGARKQSGPAPDPNSLRSAKRGLALTTLPAEGFSGRPPALTRYIPKPTARHKADWVELWKSPQACVWSIEPWRWRQVADLVKYQIRSDDPDSPVGLATAIRQLRDDLGLTKAGLAANGWTIAANEIAEKQAEKSPAPVRTSARSRMTVVKNASGG